MIKDRLMLIHRWKVASLVLGLVVLCTDCSGTAQQRSYVGFDRNDYPGDAALPALKKSFQFTGYWLNNPPGTTRNSWAGKRTLLRQSGFGFLVLFNGRAYAELKGKDAAALGTADGKAAAAAARREGFPKNVIVFLDVEEGGRLLQEQADYIFAWADAVRAGGARAGVYCSGIETVDSSGKTSTAQDVAQRERLIRTCRDMPQGSEICIGSREKSEEHLRLWVAEDQCPPSPGCTMANPKLSAVSSPALKEQVIAWQYALSPKRQEFTGGCPANYSTDGQCYAPGLAHGANSFVDLNTAESADPSQGR